MPKYNAIESLKLMAEVEAKIATLKAQLAEKAKAFEDENAGLWNEVKEGEAILATAKDELRAEALKAFEVDPSNKKPFPAVQIKVMKKYDVDKAKGLAWAKTEAPLLVKEVFDDKAFTKMIPALSVVPDFVIVTEEPQAQIASDLNAALQAVSE